jgi:hypothetical protein
MSSIAMRVAIRLWCASRRINSVTSTVFRIRIRQEIAERFSLRSRNNSARDIELRWRSGVRRKNRLAGSSGCPPAFSLVDIAIPLHPSIKKNCFPNEAYRIPMDGIEPLPGAFL